MALPSVRNNSCPRGMSSSGYEKLHATTWKPYSLGDGAVTTHSSGVAPTPDAYVTAAVGGCVSAVGLLVSHQSTLASAALGPSCVPMEIHT